MVEMEDSDFLELDFFNFLREKLRVIILFFIFWFLQDLDKGNVLKFGLFEGLMLLLELINWECVCVVYIMELMECNV